MKNTMNPNHHLWNNHGTWFVCYTVYPTPLTKERRRESLRTKSVDEARRRRDELFARVRAGAPDFPVEIRGIPCLITPERQALT